jgi:hypothetical protein
MVLKQTELDTCTLLWLVVKLSKFTNPSTDGIIVHCYIVHLVVNKIATVQECACCVLSAHAATTNTCYSATRWYSSSLGFTSGHIWTKNFQVD